MEFLMRAALSFQSSRDEILDCDIKSFLFTQQNSHLDFNDDVLQDVLSKKL